MWGASARAHVHTSFERWYLLARSSVADQGVILVVSVNHLKYVTKLFSSLESFMQDVASRQHSLSLDVPWRTHFTGCALEDIL